VRSADLAKKGTAMTVRSQPSDTVSTCANPTGPATPHGKLIILVGVALVVLVSVAAAVIALTRPAAHLTFRPLTGTGAGTMTLSLTTGMATTNFAGQLSPLGADTGHDNLAFTITGPGTFTYTGTRTFVGAGGNKLFSTVTGEGTYTKTSARSTETDTITGGTGRFTGATGTYTDTITSVVVSATSTSQTSHVTAVAHGQIRS
jgi:hypothetical protein